MAGPGLQCSIKLYAYGFVSLVDPYLIATAGARGIEAGGGAARENKTKLKESRSMEEEYCNCCCHSTPEMLTCR